MSTPQNTQTEQVVTSAKNRSYPRTFPILILNPIRSGLEHIPLPVMAVIVALVTFLIQGYRLNAGPDVFSDEGLYLLVGLNMAKGIGIAINHGPFLYHPPFYFLIEGAYIKLMGLTNTDLLSALFSVRYINVFFSAATAALLLLYGRKLHSYKAGLIMVVLFLMDPYVQRINRRNMLETLTMLCLLLGFYIFFTRQQRLKTWQWLGSGVVFGLAVLTKEAMFAYLPVILLITILTRRTQIFDAVRTIVVAGLIYLCYPLGEVIVGNGHAYISLKLTELGWVLGSPTGRSLTASSQKTFSFGNLENLLGQYASSYVLVALAGVMTVILFLCFRNRIEARFLLVWSIFSFGYDVILGRTSDQYLYFLIVPAAIIVNGYSLTLLSEILSYRRGLRIVVPLFLCLLFIYNSFEWIIQYGYESDNGYAKIITYVQTHIPPGTTIDVSDDVGNYLFPSTYNIRLDRDKKFIIGQHERYFIMSSKDSWGGYDGTTPELYNWVIQNSRPIIVERDNSFWTIGLYYLNEPVSASHSTKPIIYINKNESVSASHSTKSTIHVNK